MRAAAAVLCAALVVALAGCGASTPTGAPAEQARLDAVAGAFHSRDANRTVAPNQIPLKFLDMEGKAVDLASFRGTSNVLLVVVKGLPNFPGGRFCPGCLAQVNALAANHAEFQKRQTEILMVFPGPTDRVADFLAQGRVDDPRLPFPLLQDTDQKAVTALGIAGDWAKPSTYILDKGGNAVFAFVGEGTTDRPSVSSLLARLDKLNATR